MRSVRGEICASDFYEIKSSPAYTFNLDGGFTPLWTISNVITLQLRWRIEGK